MNFANLMQGMSPSLLDTVGQSVLWGIIVLGVYIAFRLLGIVNLTINENFTLGDYVCTTLIMDKGMNPAVILFMATLIGMATDFVTGIPHTVFEIPSVLVGILTQIPLWSIDLWIMEGSSDISLLEFGSIVAMVSSAMDFNQAQASQTIGIAVAVLMVVMMCWLFNTEINNAPRVTGNNEDMIRALGVNTKQTKPLTLMLSNDLVGISGTLVRQGQEYADIRMGTGTTVVRLVAIVIGEVFFGWFRSFALKLSTVVVGSMVHFVIWVLVVKMGINPDYMKFLSTVVVTLAIYIPVAANKQEAYKEYSEGGNV